MIQAHANLLEETCWIFCEYFFWRSFWLPPSEQRIVPHDTLSQSAWEPQTFNRKHFAWSSLLHLVALGFAASIHMNWFYTVLPSHIDYLLWWCFNHAQVVLGCSWGFAWWFPPLFFVYISFVSLISTLIPNWQVTNFFEEVSLIARQNQQKSPFTKIYHQQLMTYLLYKFQIG